MSALTVARRENPASLGEIRENGSGGGAQKEGLGADHTQWPAP